MDIISLCVLVEMALPERTLRLTDGGEFVFDGGIFIAKDDVFGTIGVVDSLSEGDGSEAPSLAMSLFPAENAAIAALFKTDHQTSRVRIWLQRYNQATGQITSNFPPVYDGEIDVTDLILDKGTRRLDIDLVTRHELLFYNNEANSLTPNFHKKIYPGETGHDAAIDLPVPVSWGTASPPRGQSSGVSGGGGGGRGFGASVIGGAAALL